MLLNNINIPHLTMTEQEDLFGKLFDKLNILNNENIMLKKELTNVIKEFKKEFILEYQEEKLINE